MRSRSSGAMRWSESWAWSPRAISIQSMRPLNALAFGSVVVADGGGAVDTDVGGFIAGEEHRLGGFDAASADPGAVQVEGDVAALGEAATVVAELHAQLVVACRKFWSE